MTQSHNRGTSFSLYLSALAVSDTIALLLSKYSYTLYTIINSSLSQADSGFSLGGGAKFQSGIILQFFCRKLHENERVWTLRWHIPGAPLDPSMITIFKVHWWLIFTPD